MNITLQHKVDQSKQFLEKVIQTMDNLYIANSGGKDSTVVYFLAQELGVVQSSCFCYVNNWKNPRKEPIDDGQHIIGGVNSEKHLTRLKGRERGTEVEFISAYNAMELGVLLPNILPYEDLSYGIVLRQTFPDGKEQEYYMAEYVEVYSDLDYGCTVYEETGETEAISRACLPTT